VEACKRIISECKPHYWIIENVRGAVPYLGKQSAKIGPFYLWGHFPDIGTVNLATFRKKEAYSSAQREQRAMIPYELSLAVALAIECQSTLIDTSLLLTTAWSGQQTAPPLKPDR